MLVSFSGVEFQRTVLCSRDHLLNGVARSHQASKGVGQEEGKKGEESPSKPPNPAPPPPPPRPHTATQAIY